jgi:hypothetical protein
MAGRLPYICGMIEACYEENKMTGPISCNFKTLYHLLSSCVMIKMCDETEKRSLIKSVLFYLIRLRKPAT